MGAECGGTWPGLGQLQAARDLPGSPMRRRLPFRFEAYLLGQPTHDPLGNGEFLPAHRGNRQ